VTASERSIEMMVAIQEATNCLFYLRELRADPPLVKAEELEQWGEYLDRVQRAFAEIAVEVQAGRAQTSLRLSSALTRSFADVRAHLSEIASGAQLPATLFDLVDVAWSEFTNAFDHED
jgi:hypothetical protein